MHLITFYPLSEQHPPAHPFLNGERTKGPFFFDVSIEIRQNFSALPRNLRSCAPALHCWRPPRNQNKVCDRALATRNVGMLTSAFFCFFFTSPHPLHVCGLRDIPNHRAVNKDNETLLWVEMLKLSGWGGCLTASYHRVPVGMIQSRPHEAQKNRCSLFFCLLRWCRHCRRVLLQNREGGRTKRTIQQCLRKYVCFPENA